MGRPKGSKNKPKIVTIVEAAITPKPTPLPPIKEKKTRKPRTPKIDNSVQLKVSKPLVEPIKDKSKASKEVKPVTTPVKKVVAKVTPPVEEERERVVHEDRGPYYLPASLSALFLDRHPLLRSASTVVGLLPQSQYFRLVEDAEASNTTAEQLVLTLMLKGVGLDEETRKKVLNQISDFKPPVGQLYHRVKRS